MYRGVVQSTKKGGVSMEDMTIVANAINLVTAVIQFATALLMYKAYREQNRR